MRAAERAKTSSRSSEEFTSSPISASVARTSAESSAPVLVVCASACAPGGFMDSIYYSRRRRTPSALFGGFPRTGPLLVVQELTCTTRAICYDHGKNFRAAHYLSAAFLAGFAPSDRTPTYGKFR